jgi:hypothetical protein
MKRLILLFALVSSTLVRAEEPLKVTLFNALWGRINPLGIEDHLYIGLQGGLYDAKHVALRDNYLNGSVIIKASPSSLKVGPSIELQPLSVLNLRFSAEVARWFGVFTTFQSFGSALDDYSDTALFRLAQNGDIYATTEIHLSFAPRLQVKFGPIVVRDQLSIDYYNATLRPGDTVFYESTGDTLLEPGGIEISNTADVLYSIDKYRMFVGLEHALFQPFYSDHAYRPGEPHINPNGNQRLVAMGVWTFYQRPKQVVNMMTLIVQAGFYLQHRYRTGADVNEGVPYLLGGFAFQADWPRR